MPIWTIILNVLFLGWMFLALFIWWRMWRNNLHQTHKLYQLLVEVANKNAEAAIISAKAAQDVAFYLNKSQQE